MIDRTEIYADGTYNDKTRVGAWASVIHRSTSGRQEETSSYEMELRALVEAAKMAEGPTTIISDYHGMIRDAQQGKTPEMCKAVWEELYAAMAGKDVSFEWRKRDQSFGQRLAHQIARDTAKGR